jgi:predicted nucleic acid-binding protein
MRIVLDTNVVMSALLWVIAAAVAAQADLIVSGDRKHLLPLGSHAGISIVDAAEALRRITASTNPLPPV